MRRGPKGATTRPSIPAARPSIPALPAAEARTRRRSPARTPCSRPPGICSAPEPSTPTLVPTTSSAVTIRPRGKAAPAPDRGLWVAVTITEKAAQSHPDRQSTFFWRRPGASLSAPTILVGIGISPEVTSGHAGQALVGHVDETVVASHPQALEAVEIALAPVLDDHVSSASDGTSLTTTHGCLGSRGRITELSRRVRPPEHVGKDLVRNLLESAVKVLIDATAIDSYANTAGFLGVRSPGHQHKLSGGDGPMPATQAGPAHPRSRPDQVSDLHPRWRLKDPPQS